MPTTRLRASIVCALVLVTLAACRDAGPSLAERAAAAKAAEEAADTKAREATRAQLEAQRVAALWRYQEATVGGGAQVTAAIYATDDVDADGQGPKRVQLVFRDHVKWGRSGYLVLQAGDFACRPTCMVQVTADDGPPRTLAAWRPDTDEAIALFIRDTKAFWRITGDAARLRITFPVTAGGTREASFEVVSLDESKMPGW
ncbi:MAG: hypothetical protein IT181_10900 [Acidobacteria bacterium]|nr:hypothetical protein [Acidobacteriota bacterium]